jgi:phage head maturation protease
MSNDLDVEILGGRLTGVAMRFGAILTTCNRQGKPNRPATICRTAVNRALREAENIQMLVGHNPRRIACDTKSGTLFFEVRGDKLLFTAWPWKTRDGFAAWFGTLAGRFVGVSFGGAPTITTHKDLDIIEQLDFWEISLTDRPAESGTFVVATDETQLAAERAEKVARLAADTAKYARTPAWLAIDPAWRNRKISGGILRL